MTSLEDLAVVSAGGGAQFAVKVVPGARREGIAGVHGDALKVAVRDPPEKGKANAALIELLSRALALAPSRLQIVSGRGSRTKRVRAHGLSPDEVRTRLGKAFSPE